MVRTWFCAADSSCLAAPVTVSDKFSGSSFACLHVSSWLLALSDHRHAGDFQLLWEACSTHLETVLGWFPATFSLCDVLLRLQCCLSVFASPPLGKRYAGSINAWSAASLIISLLYHSQIVNPSEQIRSFPCDAWWPCLATRSAWCHRCDKTYCFLSQWN